MSTVKISQLSEITHLDSNTANTIMIGVDKVSGVTGQFTAQTLSHSLFANNVLNVGNNDIVFPGVIGQFVGNNASYLQINLQNKDGDGSADYVVTSDVGTDTKNFVDVGIAGSTYNYPGWDAIQPLDSYVLSVGDDMLSYGGNLIIGSTQPGTYVKFLVGGSTANDYYATLSDEGLELLKRPIIFADGSTQNSSASFAETFANGAFVTANSGSTFANAAFVRANSSYDSQNTTASFANGAFTKANSGFATANSAASFANGAFVSANSGATFANAAFTRANSGYAAANSAADFANGAFTKANTAVTTVAAAYDHANAAYGYANTSLQNTSSIVVDTNLTVPGTLTISGAIYAANTIRTPNIFPGSQTAITLSFQNSGLVKANIAADLAITLASFVPGKFVDMFITNTTGQGKSITHGCSAINSTVGATTFNLAATRTAYLRYTSFNDDLANTVVAITYQ